MDKIFPRDVKDLLRYIIKVQFRKTTVGLSIRDIERGKSSSATFSGLRELLEKFVNRIEEMTDVKVGYE